MGAGRWGAARPPISGYYQGVHKDALTLAVLAHGRRIVVTGPPKKSQINLIPRYTDPPDTPYTSDMSNPNYKSDSSEYDNDLMPYDDTFDAEDFVEELVAEGYSEEEARRMAGDYDADEYYGLDEDNDRDIPDFIDDGDFE